MLILLGTLTARPATRFWTGASATSGNWTTAANWQGNVVPSPGDILQFVEAGARKTSNTNNFPAGTTFSVINCFGAGSYRLRGNRVTITNSVNVGNPAGSHVVDFDIGFASLDNITSINSFSSASSLTINGDLNLGSSTVQIDGAGDVTVAGVISGTGGVFKTGGGTLSYAGLGANTYSGQTRVTGGILRLNRYNLAPGSGGFVLTGTTGIAGDLSIGDFVSTLIGDIVVLDRDNQIANTSTVFVNPTGSLELSDENDTIGELQLRGGTVTTGSGLLAVEGGIYASLPLNVTKDSLIAGRLSLGSRGDGPQFIDVAQGVQLNVPAHINGPSPATLIKTNRGELVLSASNTFSGDVEIRGGTLTLQNTHALGNTNGLTRLGLGTIVLHEVGVGDVLEVAGPNALLTVDSFGGSWNGPVILNEDLNVSVPTNRTVSITGQISGPAGWIKTGPGNLVFRTTYTHTYAGAGQVRQGDFIMENVFSQVVVPGPLIIGDGTGGPGADEVRMLFSHGVGDTSPVTINSSGLWTMSFHNDTIGSLAGSGQVDLGVGTLTVGANNTSTIFSGVISGTGGVVKTGLATLTLTGNNTYAGITTNQSGTLLVDGVLNSSTVRVQSGAILGGNGQVQSITSLADGEVSPGASPGRLTVQGEANLANINLRMELNGTAPATEYDQLRVNGNVDISNARLFFTTSFPPTTNDTFLIVDKTSPGPITGFFLDTTEGSVMGTGFNTYRITYQGGDGNDVVLRRVEIPGSNITGISPATDGKMQITGQGDPFVTYILEATATLNAPIPWTPIATNTANALGIYEFIDAFADGGMNLHPVRFYRVQSP